METPSEPSEQWQFNAPQFVDFNDENTFQADDEQNDQFFIDAKENDEFFSPRSSVRLSVRFNLTPGQSEKPESNDRAVYDLRKTPLRDMKNNGGTPYREARSSRAFGKRSTIGSSAVKDSFQKPNFCDQSKEEEEKEEVSTMNRSTKRDTFNVSSLKEALEQSQINDSVSSPKAPSPPKTAAPATAIIKKIRPPLYQPKKFIHVMNRNVASNNNDRRFGQHKTKRAFNVPSTETAYNFMNSMRRYSPMVRSKPTHVATVPVGPKFLTDSRFSSRVNAPRVPASKPEIPARAPVPKPEVRPRVPVSKPEVRPRVAASKPQVRQTAPAPKSEVRPRFNIPKQEARRPVASAGVSKPPASRSAPAQSNAARNPQPKRAFGPMAQKKVFTKAITPHFASDDRIKVWHRKHDDEVDQAKAPVFKAKPAPDFKKLHARSKIAQYSMGVKP